MEHAPISIHNDQLFTPLLKLYEHHIMQFDRLIHIIEILKEENQLLRNKFYDEREGAQELLRSTKPRITCRF